MRSALEDQENILTALVKKGKVAEFGKAHHLAEVQHEQGVAGHTRHRRHPQDDGPSRHIRLGDHHQVLHALDPGAGPGHGDQGQQPLRGHVHAPTQRHGNAERPTASPMPLLHVPLLPVTVHAAEGAVVSGIALGTHEPRRGLGA